MKVLVFDTETTGLPQNNPSIYQTHLWPHVVQLSYMLYDTDKNKIIASDDYLIKIPKDVEISQESIDVHGITRRKVDNHGYKMNQILQIFQVCLDECDFIVAHNLQFDKKDNHFNMSGFCQYRYVLSRLKSFYKETYPMC